MSSRRLLVASAVCAGHARLSLIGAAAVLGAHNEGAAAADMTSATVTMARLQVGGHINTTCYEVCESVDERELCIDSCARSSTLTLTYFHMFIFIAGAVRFEWQWVAPFRPRLTTIRRRQPSEEPEQGQHCSSVSATNGGTCDGSPPLPCGRLQTLCFAGHSPRLPAAPQRWWQTQWRPVSN